MGRTHPLTRWHFWKHLVDEVRSGVRHASSDTRWAEAAALAGERYDEVVAAVAAAQVDEAAVEEPALEARLELAQHELPPPART